MREEPFAAEDLVTDRDRCHAFADLVDDTGEIVAVTGGQRERGAVCSGRVAQNLDDLPVDGIQARGGYAHAHLPGAGARRRHLVDPQGVDAPP